MTHEELVQSMASIVRGQSLVNTRTAKARVHNEGVESAAIIVEQCLPGLLEQLGEREDSLADRAVVKLTHLAWASVDWAESAWAVFNYRARRHLPYWEWLESIPSELMDVNWYARLKREMCGRSGHASVVFYNPMGFEPDMTCTRCGEDIG